MTLRDLVRPWSGTALRHIPASSTRGILDDTYLGRADNRWSRRGVPAWYLAPDVGVVVAEFARHVQADPPSGIEVSLERQVWSVRVTLERTIDLGDPEVVDTLGLGPLHDWVLDQPTTQAVADLLRAHTDLQGLLAPSVAFLDQPRRRNVVVYRDRVDPRAVFSRLTARGRITLTTGDAA